MATSGGGLQSLRARVAAAARALVDGRVTWEEFEAEFGDVDDPTIAALVDLIEREPEPGGFFGVGGSAYRAYRAEVERLIAELAADA
jgi:ABC-type nitrate/sulfonate/bicarbonate transport system substrate-binding protein